MSERVDVSLERAVWLQVASGCLERAADLEDAEITAGVRELIGAASEIVAALDGRRRCAVSEPSVASPDSAAGDESARIERALIVQAEGLLRAAVPCGSRSWRELREWLEAVDVCRLRWARQAGVQV